MIVYKDVIGKLKAVGYTTYTIRQQKIIPEKTLTAIRKNEPISTKTIDTICKVLKCQPGDILGYVEDPSSTPEE